jgi:hypothetical protein
MVSKLDRLLPAIVDAKVSGLTFGALTKKFAGKSTSKANQTALRDRLIQLVREGSISGPFKSGRSEYYFAAGYGPSIETASALVASLVDRSGIKLLSGGGTGRLFGCEDVRFDACA